MPSAMFASVAPLFDRCDRSDRHKEEQDEKAEGAASVEDVSAGQCVINHQPAQRRAGHGRDLERDAVPCHRIRKDIGGHDLRQHRRA